MKRRFVHAAAVLALSTAAVVAVPAAASAYSPETPTAPAPGITVPVTTPTGLFAPSETVTFLLSGEDANFASLAVVRAAYVSSANLGTKPANADGSTSFSVTLPDTATGRYSLMLTSSSRPQGYEVIIGSDGAVVSGSASSGNGGLPATGMDSGSLLGLWVGGGALVLAGGAVAVGAAVQRQRRNADA